MPNFFQHTLISLAILILGLGCAANRNLTQTSGKGPGQSPAIFQVAISTPVILITPKVVVEDARSGASLGDFSRDSWIYQDLITKAKTALTQKRFSQISQTHELANLSEAQTNAAYQLSANSHRLLRVNTTPELRDNLHQLGESAGNKAAALLQFIRVKRGPTGTWDPNTGAITSGASSTYFQAALIECETGKALWENSVLLREAPAPGQRDFAQAINLLFANLNPETTPKK